MIPTTPGEGLTHMPHGSDWSSIREAGMKADKLGAALATPRAEMHRGTHRKVMKLSLC